MKYLFEYAKFRELLYNSDFDDKNFNFKNDEKLIKSVYIPKYNKYIFIKWYDNEKHSIIKRIKNRTGFLSTSEFNDFIRKGLIELFTNKFNEIYNNDVNKIGKYSIKFKENNFCLIMSIDKDNLFDNHTEIFIITIVNNSHMVDKEIEINDEFF